MIKNREGPGRVESALGQPAIEPVDPALERERELGGNRDGCPRFGRNQPPPAGTSAREHERNHRQPAQIHSPNSQRGPR